MDRVRDTVVSLLESNGYRLANTNRWEWSCNELDRCHRFRVSIGYSHRTWTVHWLVRVPGRDLESRRFRIPVGENRLPPELVDMIRSVAPCRAA